MFWSDKSSFWKLVWAAILIFYATKTASERLKIFLMCKEYENAVNITVFLNAPYVSVT